MPLFSAGFYPFRMMSDDRAKPCANDSLMSQAVFIHRDDQCAGERFIIALTREAGNWSDICSAEQTAYILGQLTAAVVLPPVPSARQGRDLLSYCVRLRERLDTWVIDELADVLDTCGADMNWEQVDRMAYASAIGAGMAACIDLTPGREMLYLRYTARLAEEFHNACCTTELPRSSLFLQANLDERFDALLHSIRKRALHWLTGR